MAEPLFSIIIPTYNSSKTLRGCLESIIVQSFTKYEVWIIDGSSNDQTLRIIKEFAANYPLINYISMHDKGIYDAMNKGIDLAKGEWLYFLGSDDSLYSENVLNNIAAKITSSKALVIYGNVVVRGENKWNLNGQVFAGEYNLERLLNMTICHQAIFYNRVVFKKYGYYDLNFPVAADYVFNLKCYAYTPFSYINIIIANFFVGGFSSNNEDPVFVENRGAILFKHFNTRIFQTHFINSRLYLREAAFSLKAPLNMGGRFFCLCAYAKLKIQALIRVSSRQISANVRDL